ncbi:DNA-binding response regulator [Tenacibaculum litoreum]|jgi:DNA-binding NarL/FixJ family response regulator
MMTYNIILVDDHKMFLDGLLNIFNNEDVYNILLTANSGENVIKYIKTNPDQHIDIVISDISMPDIDGITLNDYIKRERSDIKTLIVSMHTDTGMIDALIKNNVDGYLSKNATQSELLQAVQTILKGEKYFSQSVREAYMENVFNKRKETSVMLTAREKDVLKLIAEEYTTQEIADKLFLSKHTIESYRKNLISKLNVKNLAGLTKYAIKLGLVE